MDSGCGLVSGRKNSAKEFFMEDQIRGNEEIRSLPRINKFRSLSSELESQPSSTFHSPTSDLGTRKRCHDVPVKTGTACILCGYNRKNVSYHRFPTDSTRSEWLRICELPESTNTRNLKICGRHFAADVKLIRNDGSMSLKKTAIPTLSLEVYGLNGEDNEYPIQAVPSVSKLQNANKRLSLENVPSELNLAKLQNSVKRALESAPVALDSQSEHNSGSQNSLGIELVEVVEMKIYRFNSPPTSEETRLSEAANTETGTNVLDDDPENQLCVSAHIKSLEMHSYSKPASMAKQRYDSLKRLRSVRYFGDLAEEDFATPEGAKHSWNIARRVIEKKNEKILHIEAENEVLERRCKNFKELLTELRKNWSIPKKFKKRSQTSPLESHINHEVIVLD